MVTVWLIGSALEYPAGGGHLWVYLNWAMGLRANGCRVVWLECTADEAPSETVVRNAASLRSRIASFGFHDFAVLTGTAKPLPADPGSARLLRTAHEAELLLDLSYCPSEAVVEIFQRSAMVDIDPGLSQQWLHDGGLKIPRHDHYFTIGETVGTPEASFPDCGFNWHYTPPCVSLDAWPVAPASANASFTTVSHWESHEWVHHGGASYNNSKRSGFLPFLQLPKLTAAKLELALSLGRDESEKRHLEELGWIIRESASVSATPEAYRSYIQYSRGEFSCVKPSCVRLQNAWISDRTICYLASGKPAVVEHTGPSRILPDAEGLLRFRSLDQAVEYLEVVQSDYETHARAARGLAEDVFDAKKVAARLLEQALSKPSSKLKVADFMHHPT